MTDPTYRLGGVQVQNYERIELVNLIPRPTLTVVSGSNTNGKSSLLHYIAQLFEGKASRSRDPVHAGAESAAGVVRILNAAGEHEFTIEQEIRAGKDDRLVIRDAKGNPTAKNQSWLKSLIGRGLAFDPSEFDSPPGAKTAEARDKLRLEMLLRVRPIGIDLAAAKTKREDFYARRTIANRDKDTATAKIALVSRQPVPEPVDLAAKRATINAERKRATEIEMLRATISGVDAEMARIRARFEELKKAREQYVAQGVTLGTPQDVSALEAEVSAGEKTNIDRERILAANARYDELLGEIAKSKKLSDEMTESIETIDRVKAEALAAVEFPVAGLSVSESAVFYKGLPFEQASDAERLEIAFAITSADKPALSLALIDVGERFDTEAVGRIEKLCEKLGVQCLMARRSPDIADRVELVDGRVVPA